VGTLAVLPTAMLFLASDDQRFTRLIVFGVL
jgi:hypothetical protein